MIKTTEEIKSLILTIRKLLGEPVRAVELTNDQICECIETSVKDYASIVQNEVIDNNWISFY